MRVLGSLQNLIDNGLPEKAILPIVNELLAIDELEWFGEERVLALFAHRAKRESEVDLDIEVVGGDNTLFRVGGSNTLFRMGGAEYLVLTEDERDDQWDSTLDYYLDNCVEGANGPYFDREAWKRDARMDGAGPQLATYDGHEHEIKIGAGRFWIYRVN